MGGHSTQAVQRTAPSLVGMVAQAELCANTHTHTDVADIVVIKRTNGGFTSTAPGAEHTGGWEVLTGQRPLLSSSHPKPARLLLCSQFVIIYASLPPLQRLQTDQSFQFVMCSFICSLPVLAGSTLLPLAAPGIAHEVLDRADRIYSPGICRRLSSPPFPTSLLPVRPPHAPILRQLTISPA